MLAAPAAFGVLTLEINKADQTFALTGSDTGRMGDGLNFGEYYVGWKLTGLGNPNGDVIGQVSYDNDLAFTTTVGTPGGKSRDTEMVSNIGGEGLLAIQLYVTHTSVPEPTIAGTGVFQSYASMDPDALSRIDAAIGQTLPLTYGTGFSGMPVVDVTPIPEPMATGWWLGLGALGLVIGWRLGFAPTRR